MVSRIHSGHVYIGREYRKEVVIYENGSQFVSFTPRQTRQPDSPLLVGSHFCLIDDHDSSSYRAM